MLYHISRKKSSASLSHSSLYYQGVWVCFIWHHCGHCWLGQSVQQMPPATFFNSVSSNSKSASSAMYASASSFVISQPSVFAKQNRNLQVCHLNERIGRMISGFLSRRIWKISNSPGTAKLPLFSFYCYKLRCTVSWKCRKRSCKGFAPRSGELIMRQVRALLYSIPF